MLKTHFLCAVIWPSFFQNSSNKVQICLLVSFVFVKIWYNTRSCRVNRSESSLVQQSFSLAHRVIKSSSALICYIENVSSSRCCANSHWMLHWNLAAGNYDTNYHQGESPSYPQPCCSRAAVHNTSSQFVGVMQQKKLGFVGKIRVF